MTLEVGERIYDRALRKYTITRVTRTQAFAEVKNSVSGTHELCFNREAGNGESFKERGRTGWDTSRYSIETVELASKYNRKMLERRYSKIDAVDLTDEQIIKILEVASIKGGDE